MNNIGLSEDKRKEINKLINLFIWQGKPPKIRKEIAVNEKKDGGLSLPDINIIYKSLLVNWVKRYFQQGNHYWKAYVDFIFRRYGGEMIFCSNYELSKLPGKIKNSFYHDLLSSWEEVVPVLHKDIQFKTKLYGIIKMC